MLKQFISYSNFLHFQLTGAAFAAAAGGGGNQRLAAAGGGVGYAINGANGGQGVWPRIRQIAHSSTAAVFTSQYIISKGPKSISQERKVLQCYNNI